MSLKRQIIEIRLHPYGPESNKTGYPSFVIPLIKSHRTIFGSDLASAKRRIVDDLFCGNKMRTIYKGTNFKKASAFIKDCITLGVKYEIKGNCVALKLLYDLK